MASSTLSCMTLNVEIHYAGAVVVRDLPSRVLAGFIIEFRDDAEPNPPSCPRSVRRATRASDEQPTNHRRQASEQGRLAGKGEGG
jgi:hypothetical protein